VYPIELVYILPLWGTSLQTYSLDHNKCFLLVAPTMMKRKLLSQIDIININA